MPPAQTRETKTAVFQAASEAFDGAMVSVVLYPPEHPKLAKRQMLEPHIGVRVQFSGFAVAGMVPENADAATIDKLMARLKLDRRMAEDAMKPKPAV